MITLKMTNNDYFDAETEEYVMTIGASVLALQTDVRIKDIDDGTVWDCYLTSVEFVPAQERGRRDVYIARYKLY